ncbi:MAG: hypothetical protein A4S09_06990 [Proteobacteria bacterium SG_bin7]|nr:MAG: hypothetical protein A4S09_06990 [Proteobacteria bacterium SG_bin7]
MAKMGMFIVVAFAFGYYFGQMSLETSTGYVSKFKTSVIQECREEVKARVVESQTVPGEIKDQKDELGSQKPEDRNDSDPKKYSHRASEIAFESDKKEFLKQIEVKNLFEELKTAKVIGEDQLKILNGYFTGQVEFDATDRPSWDVELRMSGQVLNEEPRGDKVVSLSRNGKVFARTTGKGRIKGVLSMSSDPNSILVEVNGDEGYIQMYYLPRLDEFSGIYYHKVSIGEFEREGIVSLKRSYSSASF